MKPLLALDCRIDQGKPSSYTRVLELLRAGARAEGLPFVEWFGGPAGAPVLWSATPDVPSSPDAAQRVATLHDVTPLLIRGRNFISDWNKRRRFQRSVAKLALGADRVVTVSEFARASIAEHFPALESRLRVVPNYPAPQFRLADPTTSDASLESLNLPRDGVLFVAALRHHKNWETLLRAWASLDADLRGAHPLVLAGDARRARPEPMELARRLGAEEHLHLPGRIPDELLPALYRGAAVFVFPSFAEGFGLPPLEAMACGTAVLSSNATSLPEVLGEASVYFDPRDASELAQRLDEMLRSTARRQEFARRGPDQAASWSAERTGAAMRVVLDELLAGLGEPSPRTPPIPR